MNNLVIQGAGFPVQKKTFDFIQEAYGTAITHLCKIYGENLILYGVELVGGNRTAGAVVINGELLTFEASPDNAKILITESVEPAQYQNGELIPAYYTRTAKCSEIGTVNLTDLRRVRNAGTVRDETGWINCTLAPNTVVPPNSNYAVDILVPFDTALQARLDAQGRCWVKGEFLSLRAGEVVCTLPFKPAKQAYIKAPFVAGAGSFNSPLPVYLIEINTNGEMICPVNTYNGTMVIALEWFLLD